MAIFNACDYIWAVPKGREGRTRRFRGPNQSPKSQPQLETTTTTRHPDDAGQPTRAAHTPSCCHPSVTLTLTQEVWNNLENSMEAHRELHDHSQAGGSVSDDPRTVLTYLTFLEQKIAHGIICSAPRPPRQIVSAELSCIAVQLVSISNTLAAASGATAEEDAKSPPRAATPSEGDSDSSDHDLHAEDDHDLHKPCGLASQSAFMYQATTSW
ncbi:protein SENSITIVE TO PROTON RHIZOTOXICITY 1-like [Panicum miliaceum]|uniref:Protein SENSITIVE TO PROTON RHIZOTOXICITY 1-like n=1 Tax=Panicum miliaceum TaxID=4540 RepID=A0A3L6TLM0_PANMI|nr:protein SENSITIVE TO PROTON RHIZOTOXICITY 1-like [Panicum miliaceum]